MADLYLHKYSQLVEPENERLKLERVIVSVSLDSVDCLLAALHALPPRPFRSFEVEELERVWYWCVQMWEQGIYDGIANRELLLNAMNATNWPSGWLESEREGWVEFDLAWTPLMYEPSAVAAVCEVLRDMDEAWDQLVLTRQSFQSDIHVRRIISSGVRTVPEMSPLKPVGSKVTLESFAR